MKWNTSTPSNRNGVTRFLRRLPPQWPLLVLTIVLCDAMLHLATSPASLVANCSPAPGSPLPTRMMSLGIKLEQTPRSVTAGIPPTPLPSGISPSAVMRSGSIYTSEESGTKELFSATSSPLSGKHQRNAKTAPQMVVGLPPERLSLSGAKETLKMQP